MAPIEKNVMVVDELGNEYEATYPKRAKGLVKNGRARFVAENKICLACPPSKALEDKEMEDKKVLSAKEIFDQIVLLQNQLTENSQNSLHRLDDAITSMQMEGSFNEELDVSGSIASVCGVFAQREETFRAMLELYKKMYDDCVKEKQQKIDMAKSSFDHVLALMSDIEMTSEDAARVVENITDKISSAVSEILSI